MDMALPRRLIDGVLLTLYTRYTAKELPALCKRLGLPVPSEGNTKHERLAASLNACPDDRLPEVADAVLAQENLDQPERMALQDALWLGRPHVQVPSRTRRELSRDFDLADHLRYPDRFMALLSRLWHLDNDPLGGWTTTTNSLRSQIERHVIRFPDDWTTEHLFERLGAFEAPHPRFGHFLEGLASPAVLPHEPAQRRFVELANRHLSPVGAQLIQHAEADGYPQFQLVEHGRGTARRPRNLIFATLGKPDIRFTSALDNDIEVAERADEVLVYDRPIGKEGLLWRHLLSWWQESRNITDHEQAARALYRRMEASLPPKSPGQKNLFWHYHHANRHHLNDVPALLPEIWLHWDPKTLRERGMHAMQNLRMDFLMLLPGTRRVVLEVDGIQHYTPNEGTEPDSPTRRHQASDAAT
ncbi:AbiJ-related protein [Streptomyces sp. GSL17-111]|uniref:AbiJ-related protein n=1 Tax=Streptomyces sp. GSL17-111 TaxID=3121596 RepID=UPI0030F3D9A6